MKRIPDYLTTYETEMQSYLNSNDWLNRRRQEKRRIALAEPFLSHPDPEGVPAVVPVEDIKPGDMESRWQVTSGEIFFWIWTLAICAAWFVCGGVGAWQLFKKFF